MRKGFPTKKKSWSKKEGGEYVGAARGGLDSLFVSLNF